ncbi:MAG: AraC family transcriptional regulator [Clostridia bacterium]|nr:AraC family transcriptional regulator [Clostridia bacterium]
MAHSHGPRSRIRTPGTDKSGAILSARADKDRVMTKRLHTSAQAVSVQVLGPAGPCRPEIVLLRPGLTLLLACGQTEDLVRNSFEIDQAPVSLCCNLTHHLRLTLAGSKRTVLDRPPGHGLLSCLPETRGVTDISPGPVRGASVHFSPPVFRELFGEAIPALGHMLPDASGSVEGSRPLLRQAVMTAPVRLAVEQMLCCPFHDALRRVYLEAKALELATFILSGVTPQAPAEVRLARREKEMVRAAHALLLAQLDNPPGLEELARAVGLNRNKLNYGFRHLYGATAFTLLRDARLRRARDLLRQTETNLSEIALAVGYNSQANFTTAYRRRFGHTPAAMRRREAVCMAAATG